MTVPPDQARNLAPGQAQDLIATADTGARQPTGLPGRVLFGVALVWSLFQLWYASPLPFTFNVLNLNFVEARSVHLAFALFLAFTAFPASRHGSRKEIPIADWVLAVVAAAAAGYLYAFNAELAQRPGLPITSDLVVAVIGMLLLLEATRRALGLPLTIVGLVFLTYTFAGPLMPDIIAHKGASLAKTMSHQWLFSEGVFGVALGVSTSFVFLFVLFGALLEKAGAGNYFIQVAYAFLGHLRGGPAKAAVLSSGMTGLMSGSSIANVVTTGTFTIPLMKQVGFPAEKAGAIEVAASVNGQIMPPVMGAAAFLMVEYVGIPYIDVIKHAFLPAVISYLALLYIVHLEAMKAGMRGLERHRTAGVVEKLLSFGLTASGLVILAGLTYYGIGWIKTAIPAQASGVVAVLVAVAYLALLWVGVRYPELADIGESEGLDRLPEARPTVMAGLHFLLPVVVLVWCLMVERLSPGLSAFWATVFLIVILLTQRPIKAWLRGRGGLKAEARGGVLDLIVGLVSGARNMVGIAVATAAAGIVVGTVTMTGIGLVLTEFVEFISGGNVVLMLVFTAVISLVLGMGLPTTANYIVVATLMAPVVVELGAESGLIVPLIAVHLFVFYFGLLADVTPPVGLASFAAAAISGADPIRTGVQAFFYEMRTVALPFIFIFNNQLLLIGVTSWWHLVLTVLSATLAMLVFAAATMGYFFARSRIYETAILLLVAFILFRPGFVWDGFYPPLVAKDAGALEAIAQTMPAGGMLRLTVEGTSATGEAAARTVMLPLAGSGAGAARLAKAGLVLRRTKGRVEIAAVRFGSPAAKVGLKAGWRVVAVPVAAVRPAKEWMFIPAILLLVVVGLVQRARVARAATP